MSTRNIAFAPPDITEREIEAVTQVLRSGWITTGPRVKEFEKEIARYCGADRAVCLNSATAGLELTLRLLSIGPGDEVITTPLTFAASANVILHTGARAVFADVTPGGFHIDPRSIEKKITTRTKAVIAVDYGGMNCDYPSIRAVLEQKKSLYRPKKLTHQTAFDRPVIISDAAHAFGASLNGIKSGALADFTVFSFHAVKNLTTAEGGAITWSAPGGLDNEVVYKEFMLLALHGQNKDALAKFKGGGWKYEILLPGYKCNMTDMAAALGLVQLARYDSEILPARRAITEAYDKAFQQNSNVRVPPFHAQGHGISHHLYPLRLSVPDEGKRDSLISYLAGEGIAANVHFIPVTLHPAYTRLGYRIKDCPNALNTYLSEISLPVHSRMDADDARYIAGLVMSF